MTIKKIEPALLLLRKLFVQSEDNIKQVEDANWNKTLEKWFKDKGDLKCKISYPLTTESIVVDVGGYEGQWASDIYSKYNCKIYVFEPVTSFYDFMKIRFKENKKIIPMKYALGGKIEKVNINVYNENSSTIKEYNQSQSRIETIKFLTFDRFYKSQKLSKVDLISINIEGGEYELIMSIVESNLIDKIDHLQVQFHRFVNDHIKFRAKIHKYLRKTHKLTYNYPFVWESWTKIKNH